MAYHFNTKIQITTTASVRNRDGSYSSTEKVFAEPWADIRTMKGNEFKETGFVVTVVPVRFIIRYRKGVTTQQKVKYNGELYDIQSVANDDGKNETLTIFATLKKL